MLDESRKIAFFRVSAWTRKINCFETNAKQPQPSNNAALWAKKYQTDCMVLLDGYRRRWVIWVYSGKPSSSIGNVELAYLTTPDS